MCDKFEPMILEGQLCHSLDVMKFMKRSTRAGKTNGLRILLDPNPFRLNVIGESKLNDHTQAFKVYVHTLAQYTAFGPGEYAMTALKRMTGTDSFKQLPDRQKNCQVHNREDCETKRFLDQVKSTCNCVPWVLEYGANIEKVYLLSYLREALQNLSGGLRPIRGEAGTPPNPLTSFRKFFVC